MNHSWTFIDVGWHRCKRCRILRERRPYEKGRWKTYFHKAGWRQARPMPKTRRVPGCQGRKKK